MCVYRPYLRGVSVWRRHVRQGEVEDRLPPRGALLAHVRRDAVRQRQHRRNLAPRRRERAELRRPPRRGERARPGRSRRLFLATRHRRCGKLKYLFVA